ncbi:hypothetical protein AB4304_01995, partial [Vibrio breoganii]
MASYFIFMLVLVPAVYLIYRFKASSKKVVDDSKVESSEDRETESISALNNQNNSQLTLDKESVTTILLAEAEAEA